MNTEKEKRAIEYIKAFEPQTEPYYLCYSGGKDSDCIRILSQLAGVKADIVNNHTTVDAPETVYYIRSIPNVIIDYPKESMWQLIVRKKGPPTRLIRYCCQELKEHGGKGRVKMTGVRWAESRSRKENDGFVNIIGKGKTIVKQAEEVGLYSTNKYGGIILNDDNAEARRFVESCYRTTSTLVNPIVDWEDRDVWEFLHYYGCEGNPLYKKGFCRVGCIGCPLGGSNQQKQQFAMYPKYKEAYIRAFDKMLDARKEAGLPCHLWTCGEDVMTWWLGDNPNQMTLFDLYGDDIL